MRGVNLIRAATKRIFLKNVEMVEGSQDGQASTTTLLFFFPPFFFKNLFPCLPRFFFPPLKTRLSFAVCLSVDEGIDRPPTETRKWKERKTDQMSAQPFLVIAAGEGQSLSLNLFFFFFLVPCDLMITIPPPPFSPVFFSACSH